MQGRMVDIEKLRAANESVRAVGNMNVNARGDVLGPGGQIVTSKETVMKKYYEQPKGKVDDTPARNKIVSPRKVSTQETVKEVQVMKPIASQPTVAPKPKIEKVEPVEAKPVETFKPKTESTAKKGIDAALDGLE